MKILINTPALDLLGGVANHYLGLRKFWTENVRYNTVGRRGRISGALCLPWDVLKFIFKIQTFRPDVVLLNPSLGASALKRDFIFLRLSRCLGVKTAVFIHGFDWNYAHSIDKKWAQRNFNRAHLIFVLARAFKTEMQTWGVTSPIHTTTTKVDNDLVANVDFNQRDGIVDNILFVSRIVKAKGVYLLVDAFGNLKTKYPHLRLTIVGDGEEYGKLQSYIHEHGISNVNMTGRLSGQELAQAYIDAQLFCFPTYHGEGCPTAVLEAMAFGLPIFTRKVGGLCDFFEDGKMGFITDSFEPQEFADAMEAYVLDKEKTREVALYNAQYARRHFMASRVAVDIENKLRNHIFNL